MESNRMPPENAPVSEETRNREDVRIVGEMPRQPLQHKLATLLFVLAAVITALILIYTRVFSIRNIEINGLQSISQDEVIRLSGITGRSNYFTLNEEKIRAGIDGNRYLSLESMEKVWPNGVTLTVHERQACINVLSAGIQYTASEDGMVLESYASLRLDNGCITATGLSIRDIRVGSKIVCYSSDQLDAVLNTVTELEAQGYSGEISEINLSDLSSIYLVTTDDYVANIGDSRQLRAKIGTVRAVVAELRSRGLKGGMIEATVPGEASYRPVSD